MSGDNIPSNMNPSPTSDDQKKMFREMVVRKLEELMDAADAQFSVKTGINYVFAIAIPNDPIKRKVITDIEEMMKRNFGT